MGAAGAGEQALALQVVGEQPRPLLLLLLRVPSVCCCARAVLWPWPGLCW